MSGFFILTENEALHTHTHILTHTRAHTLLYLHQKDKIREDNPSGSFFFTGFVVLRPQDVSYTVGGGVRGGGGGVV